MFANSDFFGFRFKKKFAPTMNYLLPSMTSKLTTTTENLVETIENSTIYSIVLESRLMDSESYFPVGFTVIVGFVVLVLHVCELNTYIQWIFQWTMSQIFFKAFPFVIFYIICCNYLNLNWKYINIYFSFNIYKLKHIQWFIPNDIRKMYIN